MEIGGACWKCARWLDRALIVFATVPWHVFETRRCFFL